MREGIAPITPVYSVMREYPRTLKRFGYDTERTNRVVSVCKRSKARERELK